MSAVIICGDLSAKRPGDSEARGTILAVSRHRLRLAITEFVPAFKASGSLLLGNARFKCVQQSLRRFADVLQVNHSFRDAPAFYEQNITGVSANVRNPSGEIRNVEC